MDSKLAAGNGGAQHPPLDLQEGQHLHGFEVKTITSIDELRAVTIELEHHHSGHVYYIFIQMIQKTFSQSISQRRLQMTLVHLTFLSMRSWQVHINSRLKNRFSR